MMCSTKLLWYLIIFIYFIAGFLFMLNSILMAQATPSECDTNADCVGSLSTCVRGACHCIPVEFHPSYRCSGSNPHVNVFVIIYMILFIIASLLMCVNGRLEHAEMVKLETSLKQETKHNPELVQQPNATREDSLRLRQSSVSSIYHVDPDNIRMTQTI